MRWLMGLVLACLVANAWWLHDVEERVGVLREELREAKSNYDFASLAKVLIAEEDLKRLVRMEQAINTVESLRRPPERRKWTKPRWGAK